MPALFAGRTVPILEPATKPRHLRLTSDLGPCARRFDRQISIDRPDLQGREHIFRIHLAKLRLDKPIQYYSERMAALTPGFAGADIANVSNEAALIAARQGKDAVAMVDFEAAVDRVIGGLEKKNKVCLAYCTRGQLHAPRRHMACCCSYWSCACL